VEFSTKGLAAGTGAIVAAARVTQPVLYHHFGSKRDLFLAVVVDTYATVPERFEEWIPVGAPFEESVDRLLDCSIAVMRADPTLAAIISTVQFEIRRDPTLADDCVPRCRGSGDSSTIWPVAPHRRSRPIPEPSPARSSRSSPG
jgi:AcrR family transcriptional regulator